MGVQALPESKPGGGLGLARTHAGAVGMLVGAAVLWSTGGLIIKAVDWTPLGIAGGRSLLAALVILGFLGKPRWSREGALWGAVLAYMGTVILFVFATRLTTAANAILIQYTAPLYVALLGPWYLGERNRAVDWVAIGVILAGLVLFFLDRISPEGMTGIFCAMGSGGCFGVFILFCRKMREQPPLTALFLGNLLTGLVCLPFFVAGPYPDLMSLGGVVVLGVVQLGLSYVLFARAIGRVPAVESILLLTLEPILNPLWVLLFLGERPGAWSLVGGAIVLAGVTGRALFRARQPVPAPD